jgi:hypothetical protein
MPLGISRRPYAKRGDRSSMMMAVKLGYSTGMDNTAGMGVTGMAGTGTVSRCATRGHTVPVNTVYGYVHG